MLRTHAFVCFKDIIQCNLVYFNQVFWSKFVSTTMSDFGNSKVVVVQGVTVLIKMEKDVVVVDRQTGRRIDSH